MILSVSRSPVYRCDLTQHCIRYLQKPTPQCVIIEVDDGKRQVTLHFLSDSQAEGTITFLLWSAYGKTEIIIMSSTRNAKPISDTPQLSRRKPRASYHDRVYLIHNVSRAFIGNELRIQSSTKSQSRHARQLEK
jgi:hypothetical protein